MCYLFSGGKSLQIRDTLVQGVILLLGCDGLPDVVDDPVDHVLLFDPPHHVGDFQLVVQSLLNL